MSTSDLQGQRKSWRQKQKPGGNRWIGRVLFSIVAAALLILFLCIIFWPRPERSLQAFLIHAKSDAGAYQMHVIMPPMYGATATAEIKQRITDPLAANGIKEITGTVADIKDEIEKDILPTLQDKDDTVMIVFRGYLLQSEDGPAIACSDFGINGNQATGLLSLTEVFRQLSEQTPDSFQGTRLVVLDIEPFTAIPRLNQYDDEIFQALEASIKNYADHLWVLVTRGPLQNVGWDAKSNLPIATQTFLDGLCGAANCTDDNDDQLDLRELVAYTADRYQQLDSSSGAKVPAPMLLRGGLGRVDNTDLIDMEDEIAWITRAPEVVEPESGSQQDDSEAGEESDSRNTADDRSTGLIVTPVAFHAAQDEDSKSDSDSDRSTGGQQEKETDQDDDSADSNAADEGEASASANPSDTDPADAAAEPAPETFWDVRDRLEKWRTSDLPHPIALAPDLWRRLIQVVLHAEIESLDPEADESSEPVLRNALVGIRQLESATQAGGNGDPVNQRDAASEVWQIFEAWKVASRDESRKRPDRKVRLADRLQHAIVVANIRRWSWRKYQQQALGIGQEIVSPFDSDNALIEAEETLTQQAGDSANARRMGRSITAINQIVRRSDQNVRDKIVDLLADFESAFQLSNDKTLSAEDIKHESAWREVRRAHAWLRSPLPTAGQRRQLIAAVEKANVDTISLRKPDDYFDDSIALASVTTGTADRIRSLDFELPELNARPQRTESVSNEATFPAAFAAALRRNPIDTTIDSSPLPIIHAVTPPPRVPNPTMVVSNSDGSAVGDTVRLRDQTDHLWIELKPDSDSDTDFKLRIVDQNEASRAKAKWWTDGQNISNPEIPVTVPANESKRIRLNIDSQFATPVAGSAMLRIEVDPQNPIDDFVNQLAGTRQLNLKLAQPNRIRVQVRTPKLTNYADNVSGNHFTDGLWLRTFVSRPTEFVMTAYNESGKPCRAIFWLIRLEHPYPNNEVSEFFPEVMAKRVDYLRSRLLSDNQRVPPEILDGNRVLKGPKTIKFGADSAPSNISWKPDPPAEGEEPPQPPPAEGEPQTTDISNGLALVIRLINEADAPVGPDQIVWLMPNPWPPENYVDVQFSESSGSAVAQVKPVRRERIDGDSLRDSIPKIDQAAVQVQWQEDRYWRDFQSGTETEPTIQKVETGRPIIVQLAGESRESVMRLGVDGWPRAIRQVDLRNLSGGKEDIRWHSVQFGSVTMDYGENPPGGEDDLKMEPQLTLFNPPRYDPVFFRGGGKSLKVGIHADISSVYPDATLKIFVGDDDDAVDTHRSDRKFRTVVNQIKDKGEESFLILTTTVEDLEFTSTAGSQKNAQVLIRAEVDTGEPGESSDESETELNIHLDSTRPQVSLRVEPPTAPYYVGSSVKWIAEYSDRGNAASGVRQIQFGEGNKEEKPGGKRRAVRNSIREHRTMKLKQAGELAMAVQVWDGVGWASDPDFLPIIVSEKPKQRVKQPMSGDGSKKADKKTPNKPKKGNITGRIETKSTIRGVLKLSPAPKGITPAGGQIKVGGANPNFDFKNVPEGEYTLILSEAIIQGRSKEDMTWTGLKIDKAKDGKPFINLKLGDAQ